LKPASEERAPHRSNCYRCFKPTSHCVCERILRVENRTPIHIVQHPRERFHAIGTARFARLGLARVSLVVPGDSLRRNLRVAPRTGAGIGLLFPGTGSRPLEGLLPEERPAELIVLDGTWSQARRLYEHNEWMGGLTHFSLSPEEPSRYRIRKAPRHSHVSTLEAIVLALRELEPGLLGLDELLSAFDGMIDAQVLHTSRNPRHRPRRPKRA
jgi:DTW domain-containing protein YfiP